MIVEETKDKEQWESFLHKVKEKTFCHSYSWGEFNAAMGDQAWRFFVKQQSDFSIIAGMQVLKISARRGKFIFVPMGPVILDEKRTKEIIAACLEKLKELARQEKASFIRVSPILLKTPDNDKIFKDLGFLNAPIHMHPELTWELDLSPSLEDLLKNMRKTTRYLIKQGEKDPDLKIIKSTNEKDLEDFQDVYKITADRHSFTPFSFNYLKKELAAFKKDQEIVIFSGQYKNEIISSAMVIYWSEKAFYHQGASSLKHPKIPASYLIQWEAIKEAKARGCSHYNFWGIAPEEDLNKNKNHPWFGLSMFKKGFGGYKKEYVKTKDYPTSFFYWSTYIFEQIRKKRRNL
jgi:lipid II:glycine glycyltransferase (peptidoglycan interpeptide bridge formation enzyme)